jgi:hypothetical protein
MCGGNQTRKHGGSVGDDKRRSPRDTFLLPRGNMVVSADALLETFDLLDTNVSVEGVCLLPITSMSLSRRAAAYYRSVLATLPSNLPTAEQHLDRSSCARFGG